MNTYPTGLMATAINDWMIVKSNHECGMRGTVCSKEG